MSLWDLVQSSFSPDKQHLTAVEFFDSSVEPSRFSYGDVLGVCDAVVEVFEDHGVANEVVSIHFDDDEVEIVNYVPVLLAAARAKCPFYFIASPEPVEEVIKVDSRILISSRERYDGAEVNIRLSDTLFVTVFKDVPGNTDLTDAAYLIRTSGTTGDSKLVTATFGSVKPNILDFCSIFKPLPGDQVFMASPPTFDPHIIDVFVALSNSSCLLIVPRSSKTRGKSLFSDLFIANSVSILQSTPSLLQRIFLSSQPSLPSSLRVLCVGGESCSPAVCSLLERIGRTGCKVFHLYGVTEMSVWQVLDCSLKCKIIKIIFILLINFSSLSCLFCRELIKALVSIP